MSIKAIQTVYNGYKFRSRLEARWAVFFDGLGIIYEYELEGYELPGGGRYLPDFFLPSLNVHVEIKPPTELTVAQISKLVRFAADCDKPTLLIVGTPTNESMCLLDRVSLAPWGDFESDADDEELLRALFWESAQVFGNVCFATLPQTRAWQIVYRDLPPSVAHQLSGALLAAKQARFEHGESLK